MTTCLGLQYMCRVTTMGGGVKNLATTIQQCPIQTLIFKKVRYA